MALSITVHGQGTFTASMEEGPVTFTAAIASVGPQGATGATGATGVVSATAPITYDSGTQTVGISATPTFTSVTATTGNLTTVNLTTATFADATSQTTAFIGEARKEYIVARNATGSTIAAGKVVYLSGATGNKPTVALALADAEATSARTIGVTAEAIANNADGKVIISGAVENIDTSAFTAGDTLYLSATTAGGYTTSLPAAPLHGVVIGIVTRANPSVGSIEVAIQNYQELKELSDVNVSDRANNDGLFWESSSSTWRSKTIAEILGYTPANNASVLLSANNLSDLASASTARTNLGLGTMAVETASNYLTTSTAATTYYPIPTGTTSQYLRGNGSLSTFSTDVIAAVPSASTTTAGKVELATDTEVLTKTSTVVAVTPASLVYLLTSSNVQRYHYMTADTATSGTGGLNDSVGGGWGRRTNGPTSTGVGYVRAGMVHIQRGATSTTGIDWSKIVRVSARIIRGASTISTESVYRMCFGEPQATNTGDLPNRGIGIRIAGTGAMNIMAHNGTTLTTYATSYTPIINTSFDLVLVSDGAGNVEAFVNGSSVGSTTGGPTTSASTSQNYINVRVENTSSFTANPSQYSTYNMTVETVYT